MKLLRFHLKTNTDDIEDIFINPVHIVNVYRVPAYMGCRIEVVNRTEPLLIAEELNDVLTKLHDC